MVRGPAFTQGIAVGSNGLLVQPQQRRALHPPAEQFRSGAGVVVCVVRGIIWPLAAALASTLLPAHAERLVQ